MDKKLKDLIDNIGKSSPYNSSATEMRIRQEAINRAQEDMMRDLQRQAYEAQIRQQQQAMANQSYQNIGSNLGNYSSSFGGGAGGNGYSPIGQAGFSNGTNKTMDPLEEELKDKGKKLKIQDLDVVEATDVIEKVLKTSIVPFLWGPPGIGKSTIVRDIAKKHDWELIDLRLSLLNPVDLRGLPVVDKENKQADWYPPAFLPKYDSKKTGILFLDEINLAPLSVQAAAYQLILDKKVGEYRFPPHWRIIAAGNRETDKANVYKLSAPLANRFVHFNLTFNLNSWRDWAERTNIRPEVIDFLILRPALLMQMPNDSQKAFPTPRSWHFTSELLEAFGFEAEGGITDHLHHMIIGTIGEGVGKEFIAFLKDYEMKGVSKMVDDFIKTGNYKMPKQLSVRQAFIMAIFSSYIGDKLDPLMYKKFVEKLSGEEKKTLEEFEAQNGDKIRAKRSKNVAQPKMELPMATLTRDISETADQIFVSNTSIFTTKRAILFDNAGNIEEVSFGKGDFNSIKPVVRGEGYSIAREWTKGSYIQSI